RAYESLTGLMEQARSRTQRVLGGKHVRKQRAAAVAATDYQILRPHQRADRVAQFHPFRASFRDHGLVGQAIGPTRRADLARRVAAHADGIQSRGSALVWVAIRDPRDPVPGGYRDLCGQGACVGGVVRVAVGEHSRCWTRADKCPQQSCRFRDDIPDGIYQGCDGEVFAGAPATGGAGSGGSPGHATDWSAAGVAGGGGADAGATPWTTLALSASDRKSVV